MKNLPKKKIEKKVSKKKIIVNEKSIPKGCYCYKIKSDSERKIYSKKHGGVINSYSVKVCPFFLLEESNREGDIREYCSLLDVEIDDGVKECDYNNEEIMLDYDPEVDEDL